MKAETRVWRGQCASVSFAAVLWSCLLLAALTQSLLADGVFVVPKFVWDKHKDINEPTQKAIIVHDAGREELILQVKYDGPVEEFGWLIPVPNLPTVKKGSMECFYELSKFTQKNLESHWMYNSAAVKGHAGGEEPEPPVKVIEVKTVGAYEIAVLSTRDAGALENWLKANQFAIPPNSTDVIDSYVKQQWYFVAVKVNLKKSTDATVEKLASGELHPLQISFASERCIFPLKISSLNNTPTEVQVYVLSPEPLVERRLFELELNLHAQWRTNMLAKRRESMERLQAMQARFPGRSGRSATNLPSLYMENDYELSSRSEINAEKVIPYTQVARKDIPVCSKEIALLNKTQDRWLMKQTWTFKPKEMRDLEFEPAVPIFAAALADEEGVLAAANLMRLGTNGAAALIAAMQTSNAVVRAHASCVAEQMYTIPARKQKRVDEEEGEIEDFSDRLVMNPALLKLLPTLLNDRDPEVRLHAVAAAMNSRSPAFFNRMLELLRDDNSEVIDAAKGYLQQQREELPKHVPLFLQMLRDTNVSVQIAGLRLLMNIPQVEIPREELLALFSVPRMEVAGAAVGQLQKNISCEEAKPLLHNTHWMVRMIGLAVLIRNANKQSVELAIPLLRDTVEIVQVRAHDLLTDLTGQNFPMEQPEKWEQWWEQNKATFSVDISPEQLRKKRLERARERRSREDAAPP